MAAPLRCSRSAKAANHGRAFRSPRPLRSRATNTGRSEVECACLDAVGGDELLITDTGRTCFALPDCWRAIGRVSEPAGCPAAAPRDRPRHLALHAATGAIYVSDQNSGGVSVIARTAGRDGPRLELVGMVASVGSGATAAFPRRSRSIRRSMSSTWRTGRTIRSPSSVSSRRAVIWRCVAAWMPWVGIPAISGFRRDGRWLIVANQDLDDLTVFRVEDGGRRLAYTGRRFTVATPTAVCF